MSQIALVKWTEDVGLAVIKRDLTSLNLQTSNGDILNYTILQMFPFTSETKRMGIIVKDVATGDITFYLKGADVVMSSIVQYTDWLEEECGNMAREGLRTLVVARKNLTEEQYLEFEVCILYYLFIFLMLMLNVLYILCIVSFKFGKISCNRPCSTSSNCCRYSRT